MKKLAKSIIAKLLWSQVNKLRQKNDFKVVAVSISIHDPTGDLIEQGEAVIQFNEIDWIFVARVSNERWVGSKITATATDMPGNNTSMTVVLSSTGLEKLI